MCTRSKICALVRLTTSTFQGWSSSVIEISIGKPSWATSFHRRWVWWWPVWWDSRRRHPDYKCAYAGAASLRRRTHLSRSSTSKRMSLRCLLNCYSAKIRRRVLLQKRAALCKTEEVLPKEAVVRCSARSSYRPEKRRFLWHIKGITSDSAVSPTAARGVHNILFGPSSPRNYWRHGLDPSAAVFIPETFCATGAGSTLRARWHPSSNQKEECNIPAVQQCMLPLSAMYTWIISYLQRFCQTAFTDCLQPAPTLIDSQSTIADCRPNVLAESVWPLRVFR